MSSALQPIQPLIDGAHTIGFQLKKGFNQTQGLVLNFAESLIALCLLLGSTFTLLISSFVSDLVTPFLGLIGAANLPNLFVVLKCPSVSKSPTGCSGGFSHPYATVQLANLDGAVTWNYGQFLNNLIQALLMFLVVKLLGDYFLAFKKHDVPQTKECEECAMQVPIKARKCHWCLSPLNMHDLEVVVVDDDKRRGSIVSATEFLRTSLTPQIQGDLQKGMSSLLKQG
ncbi:hypothetical protein BDR26DRAFT_923698 [Obelidium mucronatum]|nr:hypothetical protein BDR26DRAFT_923698 [Obelidium mucronatum]